MHHVSGKRKKAENQRELFCLLIFLFLCQQEGDEGTMKRPEVKAEDLIGARDKLAFGTEVKSKTFEVMQECGKSSS